MHVIPKLHPLTESFPLGANELPHSFVSVAYPQEALKTLGEKTVGLVRKVGGDRPQRGMARTEIAGGLG